MFAGRLGVPRIRTRSAGSRVRFATNDKAIAIATSKPNMIVGTKFENPSTEKPTITVTLVKYIARPIVAWLHATARRTSFSSSYSC